MDGYDKTKTKKHVADENNKTNTLAYGRAYTTRMTVCDCGGTSSVVVVVVVVVV